VEEEDNQSRFLEAPFVRMLHMRSASLKIHPVTIYHAINDKTLHACSFIRVCLFIRQFRVYHRTFNFQSSSPLSYDNNDNGFHVFVSLLTYLFLP
jgi:hypothetical protein